MLLTDESVQWTTLINIITTQPLNALDTDIAISLVHMQGQTKTTCFESVFIDNAPQLLENIGMISTLKNTG